MIIQHGSWGRIIWFSKLGVVAGRTDTKTSKKDTLYDSKKCSHTTHHSQRLKKVRYVNWGPAHQNWIGIYLILMWKKWFRVLPSPYAWRMVVCSSNNVYLPFTSAECEKHRCYDGWLRKFEAITGIRRANSIQLHLYWLNVRTKRPKTIRGKILTVSFSKI